MRLQISKIIEKIDPWDKDELIHKNLVEKWVASGADLFRIEKPATPNMHLVSYFVPYDKQKEKIFLVHHKKANLWLPPGGHVDVDEHPKDAASREMEEELFTKADFLMDDPLFLTVTKTVNNSLSHTDVSLWFVVKGNSLQDYRFDTGEFYDAAWFKINELPKTQMEPHLKRFLGKLQNSLSKS